MSIVILGQQYKVGECLAEGMGIRLYVLHGDDGHNEGRRLVLKCFTDGEQFFEELARYYACPDDQYLCRIIHNYPPYAVNRNTFFFNSTFFDLYDLPHEELKDSKAMLASPLSSMGALVMEYVEGKTWDQVAPQLDEPQLTFFLTELAQAVLSLHESGEFHGKLTPDNVLVDLKAQTLKLVDLSFCPHKMVLGSLDYSPEHRRDGATVSAASDVYMFAQHFLGSHKQTPTIQRLMRDCMAEIPRKRPGMDEICRRLAPAKTHQEQKKPAFRPLAYAGHRSRMRPQMIAE